MTPAQAIVIGGGFYGSAISIYLVRKRGLKRVILIERESALFRRSSYNNQARIHNGYHYPRSFTTAFRSRVNFPRFLADWPQSAKRDFVKLYAIARRNSKVTARQFERFCRLIGAPIERASAEHRALFDRNLIEDVFEVEEYAFDAKALGEAARTELDACGVEIRLESEVTNVAHREGGGLRVELTLEDGSKEELFAAQVFNCAYSGLNRVLGARGRLQTKLKHEIAELALVKPPTSLSGLGVTVMDGPFFSMMPFPALGLHTLSHVRYTPHEQWEDESSVDPYGRLAARRESAFDRMRRDARRFLPAIEEARYEGSLFETKTVLMKNETDDGRPILFERSAEFPGLVSILGGKIDNIYDVLERLDHEPLVSA